MKIKYLSHSAFVLTSGDTAIAIDPFIEGNPNSPVKAADIKVQYVIVTHAHPDHFGDALAIAKANKATIISTFEIASYAQGKGVAAHPLHIGGGFDFPFGRVKLTIAQHGSSLPAGDGGVLTLGPAAGVLVFMGGKTVYHAGDTGLFLDMKLIGELNRLDAALLPIGDNFTMNVDDAVKAVEFLKPALSIPMHYDTFDVIKSDPDDFARRVYEMGMKARVLAFGEEIEI